jgi:hypothetical protein
MLRHAVALSALLAGLAGGCSQQPEAGAVPPAGLPTASPSLYLRFAAFELVDDVPGEPASSLVADELVWRKRRFGAFSIAPFREIAIRGARIRLELAGSAPAASPAAVAPAPVGLRLPERLSGLAAARLPGIVTRILAEPLEIEIVDDAGVLFRILADAGRVDSEGMRLADAVVAGRAGQRLEAQRLRWASGGDGIRVGGRFDLWVDGARRTGSDACFRLARSGALVPAPPDEQRR